MNAPPKLPRSGKPARTMTSREFNQHTGRAKQLADKGPVIITDRGEPAYVLISYDDFASEKPGGKRPFVSALEALAMPETADIDLMDYIPPRIIEPERFDWHDLLDDDE